MEDGVKELMSNVKEHVVSAKERISSFKEHMISLKKRKVSVKECMGIDWCLHPIRNSQKLLTLHRNF